jgi:hypothetical protein
LTIDVDAVMSRAAADRMLRGAIVNHKGGK